MLGTDFVGPEAREYSEDTARRIDLAVRELVAQAFSRAQELLRRQRQRLDTGAAWLLEHETLGEEDLQRLLLEVPSNTTEEGSG
jgi:cell division protease FtsH